MLFLCQLIRPPVEMRIEIHPTPHPNDIFAIDGRDGQEDGGALILAWLCGWRIPESLFQPDRINIDESIRTAVSKPPSSEILGKNGR
jgi:hypothetical protein